MTPALEINALTLAEELRGPSPPTILDVRDISEAQVANLPQTILIPLSELSQDYKKLAPTQKIVVMCHHGYRSLQATLFLKSKGFTNVRNLKGGIDAWSIQVDATVPRY